MSSSSRKTTSSERDLDRDLFIVGLLGYLCCIAGIQVHFGMFTFTAHVATGLFLAMTIPTFVAIRIRGDRVGGWLFGVFILKPYSLTQQKIGSWIRNWRTRNKNPYHQTPKRTFSDGLRSMKTRLGDSILQIIAVISTRFASDTATDEPTQTDEGLVGTADDNTEANDE